MHTPGDVDLAFGTPGDDVTHWSASRVTGYERTPAGRKKAKYERLTAPRADGVHQNVWSIDDLTLDTFRQRWGHGTFRCHWQIQDPDNADAAQRVRSGGNGEHFTIDPAAVEPAPPPPPPAPPAFLANPDPMASALTFARDLMTLSDARTNAMLQSLGGARGASGDSDVLARIAGLEARIVADAERRTLEDAHRAAIAAKDAEIAELKRAKEDAEREAEREPVGSIFEAGTPLIEQIPIILANTAAAFATKNPEMAASFAATVWEKYSARKANPSSPPSPGVVAPQSLPAPVQRPRVVHVAAQREDPATPRQTARAADPIATTTTPPPSGVGTTAPT